MERGPNIKVFTLRDIFSRSGEISGFLLAFKPDLAQRLRWMAPHTDDQRPHAADMTFNLRFAAAMCRVHYFRRPEPLPAAGDLPAQAAYWKQFYNTPHGRGTVQEYVKNWKRFVEPLGTA